MVSKKSERFMQWIGKSLGIDPTVPDMLLIVELEQSARLLEHVYKLTGSLDTEQAKILFLAVNNLKEAYETDTETV